MYHRQSKSTANKVSADAISTRRWCPRSSNKGRQRREADGKRVAEVVSIVEERDGRPSTSLGGAPMGPDDRVASPFPAPAGAATPREGRLDRALARASDAPLREDNRLGLLKNGSHTYDDWFGCMDVPRSFWEAMRKAGVEVRAVNPPTLGAPLGAIRRDHRKLLAVDGEYASTGGVCIGDGWLVVSPETGLPYRDTAVSVRGPAVADIDRAFAGVWDETAERLPDDERPDANDIQVAGEKAVRLVVQEPRRMRTLRMLELLTAGVDNRLWITDPYFLSMPILTQSLMATARDGVDVRVLTPATNDIAWIGRASRAGYRQFLEAGGRLFEYGGALIHPQN